MVKYDYGTKSFLSESSQSTHVQSTHVQQDKVGMKVAKLNGKVNIVPQRQTQCVLLSLHTSTYVFTLPCCVNIRYASSMFGIYIII